MLTPHLRPRKKQVSEFTGKGNSCATDTLREWKESNAERNGKTGELRLQRGHVTCEA
jgi:hypothetical protein